MRGFKWPTNRERYYSSPKRSSSVSAAQYVPEAMIRERGRVRHRLTSRLRAISLLRLVGSRCGVEGVGLIGAVNARAVAGLALAVTPGHVHTAVSLQDLRVPNFPIVNFPIVNFSIDRSSMRFIIMQWSIVSAQESLHRNRRESPPPPPFPVPTAVQCTTSTLQL